MPRPLTHFALVLLATLLLGSWAVPGRAAAPASLARGGWPMYQGNPQHTGRSPYRGVISSPQVAAIRDLRPQLGVGEISDGFTMGPDGTVYVSVYGTLYALDLRSYAVRTVFERLDFQSRAAPAIAADGRIYWGAEDSIGVFDSSGKLLDSVGSLTLNNVFGSSPAIGADGTVYFVHDGLWAVTPALDLRWSIGFPGFAHNSPAIGPDGTIYTGAPDGRLYAFTPSGEVQWGVLIGAAMSSPVVASDGTIYAGTIGARLYAVNPDGSVRWSFSSDEAPNAFNQASDPALGSDGTIYFGTFVSAGALNADAVHMYALNPDGSLKWKYRLPRTFGESVGFGVPVVDAENRVYACNGNGFCYGFSPAGELLWSYQVTPGFSGATPLIARDGLIWLLDRRGILHVLADSSLNALAVSAPSLFLDTCGTRTPQPRTVAITTTGASVAWRADLVAPAEWMRLTPETGTTPGTLTITVDPRAVGDGVFQGSVRVTTDADGMGRREATIDVTLKAGCSVFLPALAR